MNRAQKTSRRPPMNKLRSKGERGGQCHRDLLIELDYLWSQNIYRSIKVIVWLPVLHSSSDDLVMPGRCPAFQTILRGGAGLQVCFTGRETTHSPRVGRPSLLQTSVRRRHTSQFPLYHDQFVDFCAICNIFLCWGKRPWNIISKNKIWRSSCSDIFRHRTFLVSREVPQFEKWLSS